MIKKMIKNKRFALVKVLMIVGVIVAILSVETVMFKRFQQDNQIKPKTIQDKNLRKDIGRALSVHPS
jgi:hypothetical protein